MDCIGRAKNEHHRRYNDIDHCQLVVEHDHHRQGPYQGDDRQGKRNDDRTLGTEGEEKHQHDYQQTESKQPLQVIGQVHEDAIFKKGCPDQ
ncbi:hypothetical protein DSECCO2_514480 [anaerobic digester metagenome]